MTTKITWMDAIDQFRVQLDNEELSKHTIRGYLGDLGLLAKWYSETYQEPIEVGSITTNELREWKTFLRETCKQAPGTVNRRIVSASKFNKWAVEVNYANPTKMPKGLKQAPLTFKWLTKPEQNQLRREIEKTGNKRDLAIFTFLLHTGLRVEELVDARWTDIKMGERSGLITVRHGKGNKERPVTLNVEARNALNDLDAQIHKRKDIQILRGQRGPIKQRAIQTLFKKYAKRTGIDVTPHTLRHTFAKNLREIGTPLEVIAALMGHESTSTTMRYTTASQADKENWTDKMAGGAD
jgi:site-specific recombinase XerD